jgi:hypothetical protein
VLKVAAALAVLVSIGAFIFTVRSAGQEPSPAQPLHFSHRLHAGDYDIPCLYCHAAARRSAVAGVPSVRRCMGCHANVGQDKAEVQKLAGYWSRQEAIPWIKVYDVPDFVYFSHKRHVLAQIGCDVCHGAVQTMDTLTKVGTFSMQRCVQCHQERQASTDCLVCHK